MPDEAAVSKDARFWEKVAKANLARAYTAEAEAVTQRAVLKQFKELFVKLRPMLTRHIALDEEATDVANELIQVLKSV